MSKVAWVDYLRFESKHLILLHNLRKKLSHLILAQNKVSEIRKKYDPCNVWLAMPESERKILLKFQFVIVQYINLCSVASGAYW